MRSRVYLLPALAAYALTVGANANDDANVYLNGWYPCAFSTGEYTKLIDGSVFECAKIVVPLCYDGVCTSDKTIEIFVKRSIGAAATTDGAKRKAVIAMQGGPGLASLAMESTIAPLRSQLDGTVDYYTIDQRGTGRSEYLTCDAAQALTKGSPSGECLLPSELPNCLRDVNHQYDDQAAAFSTTSAAMDVRFLIDTFMSEHQVFLVGFSYGTYLAQRILQLNPPQVVGYVFDGALLRTVQGDPFIFSYQRWNEATQSSGRRLLEFCYDDGKCPIQFQSRETVVDEMLELLHKLDQDVDTNTCAQIVKNATAYDSPSVGLRTWLASQVGSMGTRAAALEMLGFIQRCGPDDIEAIRQGLLGCDRSGDPPPTLALDPVSIMNPLLYNTIVFSELWRRPAFTKARRDGFYFAGVFSVDIDHLTSQHCVQTGSIELACAEVEDRELEEPSATFFYQPDEYFDQPLVLPDNVGALIFSGGLDFSTPKQFGDLLFKRLDGSGQGVMQVHFDYGTHCGGEAVAESADKPCYHAILTSFIVNSGRVNDIDTSCMKDLPTTRFHVGV